GQAARLLAQGRLVRPGAHDDQVGLAVIREEPQDVLDSLEFLETADIEEEGTIGDGDVWTARGVDRRRRRNEIRKMHEGAVDALQSVLLQGEARGDQDAVHLSERAAERARVAP